MTNSDDEIDDQEESLRERAKVRVLAVVAWLSAEVSQASEEIAPRLRGALSGVSIPSRAIKPLALAGVVLFAAVALPAAPLGGDTAPSVESEEPVVGTTYDAPEDSDYRRVVESALGTADANAPEPPSEVRASAGTQTMSVATTIVDGEPAIVLEDDRTHSGRWVSVPTSWFREELGEVPSAAHIDHDSGDTYAAPLNVRGESATFYVKEFSTNTVTFDGEVVLTGDQAADGTQYEYSLNSTQGVDDPSINLTGVENTATDSASAVRTNGESLTADVGGTTSPRNETVTLTGKLIDDYKSVSGSFESGESRSISVDGNAPTNGSISMSISTREEIYNPSSSNYDLFQESSQDVSSWTISPNFERIGQMRFDMEGNNDAQTSEIYLAPSGVSDSNVFQSKYYAGTLDIPAEVSGTVSVSVDYQLPEGTSYKMGTDTSSSQYSVNTDAFEFHEKVPPTPEITSNTGETATSNGSFSVTTETTSISHTAGSGVIEYNLSYNDRTATKDPSVTVGDSTVSHSGILGEGETVSESVGLSIGSNSLDVSTGGKVAVEASWTEVTESRDPVVELNGDTTGYSGTLADGETVSLSADNASLVEGTNRVNISTNSPSSGPASLVGLEYRHSAKETVSATVEETTWSQTTNVSYTWSSARSSAAATLPMNERVVDVREIEVRTNGSSWSTVSSSNYVLDGTDLVVELGDVSAGETTEVRATGSKVRVNDGAITVLEPTTGSEQLDTRIRVDSAGSSFALETGSTIYGDRIHYGANATWGETTGAATFSSSGTQTLTLPDATAGAETDVRTHPVAVNPTAGNVTIEEVKGDRSEPGFVVRGDGNSEVDYTFVEAADATPYILYSETNGIVRDEGLASSPITLSDDNSDETLFFRVDEGSASGSGDGGLSGAGAAPMETASNGFVALQALIPDTRLLLFSLLGLAGAIVAVRRTGLVDEGTRGAAAVDTAQEVGTTAGGLLERVLENEIVVGALVLGGGAWVLSSGVLPPDATLIVSLSAVPVALFLVLQQFDRFDFRIWLGSTALVGVFGINALAPELASTIAEETGVLLVGGALLLGWRAISAFRAEAETPDEVTRVELDTEDNDS